MYIQYKVIKNDSQRIDHSTVPMTTLRLDAVVHHLVPILAGEDLEYGEQCDRERIEVRRGRTGIEIKLSAEQLHAQQGKDQDEQEQQEQQRYNRSHRIQQRYNKIP